MLTKYCGCGARAQVGNLSTHPGTIGPSSADRPCPSMCFTGRPVVHMLILLCNAETMGLCGPLERNDQILEHAEGLCDQDEIIRPCRTGRLIAQLGGMHELGIGGPRGGDRQLWWPGWQNHDIHGHPPMLRWIHSEAITPHQVSWVSDTDRHPVQREAPAMSNGMPESSANPCRSKQNKDAPVLRCRLARRRSGMTTNEMPNLCLETYAFVIFC